MKAGIFVVVSLIILLTGLYWLDASAAQKPATWIGGIRAATNDDGTPYNDPKAFRFQCGTAQGGPYTIETDIPDASLVPPPSGSNGRGTTLDNLLGGQSDGDFYCVLRDVNQQNLASNPSTESEKIIKMGAAFFVIRPAPGNPTGVSVE